MNQNHPLLSPLHSSYRETLSLWIKNHAEDPGNQAVLKMHQDALLTRWNFDLGPLEADLRSCYAPSPRGGDPWTPTCMLRSLLLAHLIGTPELREWVQRLTESAVLRALSGFFDGDHPARTTFYDFLHRLHDGYVKPGTRELDPSFIERARSKEAREMPPAWVFFQVRWWSLVTAALWSPPPPAWARGSATMILAKDVTVTVALRTPMRHGDGTRIVTVSTLATNFMRCLLLKVSCR